jgi:DNA-binding Lrp family transcriptional regulator
MDGTDLRLLGELERGLPLVREPFRELADRIGLTEPDVLERISRLQETGIIRKLRARINQRRVGYTANALVAWNMPRGIRNGAAPVLAGSPGVTHCYERQPVPGRWEYSFYTVHHGRSRDAVLREVSALARRAGITDYLVLFSTEEFKRAPAVRIGGREGMPA